jgi:hypothetical protein
MSSSKKRVMEEILDAMSRMSPEDKKWFVTRTRDAVEGRITWKQFEAEVERRRAAS